MSVNTSALITRLVIGSQDWSQWIDRDAGILIGTPEYENGSGLLAVKGTIGLIFPGNFYGLPSTPLFLLNPTQWNRGQSLSIAVVNSVGSYQFLPCSGQQLYILAIPDEPDFNINGSATMKLSVGCRLALEYFPPEPNRDISGVVAGTYLDRGTVITNILNYLGIPNSIGSLPYPINHPLDKLEGNFLQQAGAIANDAGYHLRCDRAGIVIAAPNTLDYSGANIANYLIGRDDRYWKALGKVAEQPIEKMTLTAVVKDLAAVNNNTEIIERGSLSSTYEFWNGLEGHSFNNASAKVRVTSNSMQTLSPNLARKVEKVDEALAKSYEFWNGLEGRSFNNVIAPISEKVTDYHLLNGLVSKSICYEYEALAKSYEFWNGLEGRSFNNVIAPLRETRTEWIRIKDGLWSKITTIYEALAKSYGFWNGLEGRSFSNAIALKSSIVEPDRSGPPSDFGDIGTNVTSDRQISVIVHAKQLAADPYRPRERTIKLEYASSKAQLTKYGENLNKFITGRSQGKQFGGAITDAVLNDFAPFQQVAVSDPNTGLVYYLKLDLIQYALTGLEAYVVFHGILCGAAAIATPTDVTKPVEIVLGDVRFRVESDSCAVIPDPLGVSPFTIDSDSYALIPNSLSPVSIFLIDSRS